MLRMFWIGSELVGNFNPPEFNYSTLGERGSSLREARPTILGDYQQVTLSQLHVDSIGVHLLSKDAADHSSGVGVANPACKAAVKEVASLLYADRREVNGASSVNHVDRKCIRKICHIINSFISLTHPMTEVERFINNDIKRFCYLLACR